jgi:hypothetical protein
VAATLEVIRLLTVRAKAEGAEQAERAIARVAEAQEKVARSAGGMAVATERTDRSLTSAARAADAIERKYVDGVRVRHELERIEQRLARAVETGARTQAEAATIFAAAQAKLASASGATKSFAADTNAAGYQVQNLRFQLNDIATGLASGGSPFMILSQQAGQISQVLGEAGGARGAVNLLGQAFMSMLNPINLAIAGFAAAAAGVSYLFSTWESGSGDMEADLERHADLIGRLKDAYGEAAKGIEAYGAESRKVLDFLAEANVRTLRSDLSSGASGILGDLGGWGARTGGVGAGARGIESAVRILSETAAAGEPDILAFREELVRLAEAASDDAGLQAKVKQWLEYTDTLAKVQSAADAAADAIERVSGPRGSTLADDMEAARKRAGYAGLERIRQGEIEQGANAPIPRVNPLRDLTAEPDKAADKTVSDYQRTIQAAQQRVASLQAEREALYMTDEAAAAYLKTLELMAAAGNPTDPAQVAEIERQAQAYARASIELQNARRAQDELKRAQEEGRRANEALGNSIVNTLEAITQGGEAAKRAIMQLVLQLAQAALFGQGPLAGLFSAGGLFGGGSAAPAASVASAAANAIIPVESRALPPIAAAASRAANDNSVAGQAWNYFASKGLAPHQVAGILGNIKAESNFNPSAIGDAGKAFGLFQHWGNRGGGPGMLGNTQAQLELAWRELQTTESGAMARLMASTDVRGATAAFAGFERPQGWSLGNPEGAHNFDGRLSGAQEALAKFGDTATAATDGLGEFSKGAGALGQALSSASSSAAGGGGGGGGILGMLFKLGAGLLGGGKPASPFGTPGYFPQYADGGITSGPSIAGEAGPEAVIPLKNMKVPVEVRMRDFRPSDGGGTIKMGDVNVHVAGDVSEKNLEIIRREVAKGQRQTLIAVGRQQQNSWRTG